MRRFHAAFDSIHNDIIKLDKYTFQNPPSNLRQLTVKLPIRSNIIFPLQCWVVMVVRVSGILIHQTILYINRTVMTH